MYISLCTTQVFEEKAESLEHLFVVKHLFLFTLFKTIFLKKSLQFIS